MLCGPSNEEVRGYKCISLYFVYISAVAYILCFWKDSLIRHPSVLALRVSFYEESCSLLCVICGEVCY